MEWLAVGGGHLAELTADSRILQSIKLDGSTKWIGGAWWPSIYEDRQEFSGFLYHSPYACIVVGNGKT